MNSRSICMEKKTKVWTWGSCINYMYKRHSLKLQCHGEEGQSKNLRLLYQLYVLKTFSLAAESFNVVSGHSFSSIFRVNWYSIQSSARHDILCLDHGTPNKWMSGAHLNKLKPFKIWDSPVLVQHQNTMGQLSDQTDLWCFSAGIKQNEKPIKRKKTN